MSHKVVFGIGFGDEGKGITTDYLCSQSNNPLVIRFSGGQQAGHTVYLDDKSHVFSNFGSGALRGISTYWSKFCTVEPIGLIREYNILCEKGVFPTLYVDPKCPITTPYDIYSNHKEEDKNKHGSCGVGIGTTINREERHYSLLFEDIFYPTILSIKLNAIKDFYGFKSNVVLDRFLEAIRCIIDSDKIINLDFPISHFGDIIFEGSQGLLLDQNIGFFPNVTRANVGSKNVLELGFNPEIFLVTRAYQTRHGNGPMTNEDIPNNIMEDPLETNVTNKYQGVFRKALLDVDLLEYGINKDQYIKQNKKSLVITCLDHIVDEYRFTYRNNLVYCSSEADFVSKISGILGIKDVYISRTRESKNIIKL